MNRFWTPLFLLGMLGILGGIAYWDERAASHEETEKQAKNKLFSDKWEPISIHYQHQSADKKTDVTLEKKAGVLWWITSPVLTQADQFEATKLWETVRDYQYEKDLSVDKSRWKDFGLTPPTTTVDLKNGNNTFTFFMGDKSPVGYGVYIASSRSETVFVGSQFIIMPLSKTLFDLRMKGIVDIPAEGISQLTYEDSINPRIALERKGGSWQLSEPTGTKIDQDAVLDYISALNRENATEIIDNPSEALVSSLLNPVPPATVLAKLSWHDLQGQASSLSFVETEEAILAFQDPKVRISKLGKDARSRIVKTIDQFRDSRLLSFKPQDVVKVKVNEREFQLKDGKWIPSAKGGALANERIPLLLTQLSKLKAEGSNPNAAISSPPSQKIELGFQKEGEGPLVIEFWADPKLNKEVILRSSKDSTPYIISPDFTPSFNLDEEDHPSLGTGDDVKDQG